MTETSPDYRGLRNLRITDGVAVDNATPVLLGTYDGTIRSVILIANPSATSDVVLKFSKSPTAPTMTATDWHWLADSQNQTPWMGVSEAIYVWALAVTADTVVNVVEAAY